MKKRVSLLTTVLALVSSAASAVPVTLDFEIRDAIIKGPLSKPGPTAVPAFTFAVTFDSDLGTMSSSTFEADTGTVLQAAASYDANVPSTSYTSSLGALASTSFRPSSTGGYLLFSREDQPLGGPWNSTQLLIREQEYPEGKDFIVYQREIWGIFSTAPVPADQFGPITGDEVLTWFQSQVGLSLGGFTERYYVQPQNSLGQEATLTGKAYLRSVSVVPEPSTLSLWLAALMGLWIVCRKDAPVQG